MKSNHFPPDECFTTNMFGASDSLDRLHEANSDSPENFVASKGSPDTDNVEDYSVNERTFEIIPGLWAELSKESIIQSANGGELLIVAKDVNVFFGKDLVFKGEGIHLEGKIFNETKANLSRKIIRTTVRDLVVSIARIIIAPLADRDQLARFHQAFGVTQLNTEERPLQGDEKTVSSKRLSKEKFAELCRNAKDDARTTKEKYQVKNLQIKNISDVNMPNIEVRAIKCEVSYDESRKDIDFPACEGNEGCTLRILIEYYMQSILNTLDILSGKKADISTSAITADIASAKTSVIGSVIGSVILGPVGFVAGSFIGANLGRKHSSSVVGGMAGAALFGPVGMVVGAAAGSEIQQDFPKETTLSSKKYDTAGSTGAWAGTIAGASAGSVLGPLGIVGGAIAGAVAGSVSGRKIVEKGSGIFSSRKEASLIKERKRMSFNSN